MAIDKQLRKIKIDPELNSVEIEFVELVVVEDEESGESKTVQIPHSVKGPFRPHKDLVDSMKKLRKHALQVVEIDTDSLPHYTVSSIKISGDLILKQSRVVMTLSKFVKSTSKIVPIKCPQVTMYPTDQDKVKYFDAEAMTTIIEDIVEEAWSYLRGKYEQSGQLPLFVRAEGEFIETNFTK